MISSVWRLSHRILALTSALFIILVCITGIFLAVEPIVKEFEIQWVVPQDDFSVADLLRVLGKSDYEVLRIEQFRKGKFSAEVIQNGDQWTFYLNVLNGELIEKVKPEHPLFAFNRQLHRSLFLKKTGRFIIGVTSIAMMLLLITGFLLLVKRQEGLKAAMGTIPLNDWKQYLHIQTGRLFFIPLLLISLSGTILFAVRFMNTETIEQDIIVRSKSDETGPMSKENFAVFREMKLNDLKSLQFPFFEDEEEYFQLRSKQEELWIDQFNGTVVHEIDQSAAGQLSTLSYSIHTGEDSWLWSFILLLASISALYLTYSGGIIYLRRLVGTLKNPFPQNAAEIIVLYGSENGTTLRFAKAFHEALIDAGQKSFIAPMNHILGFKEMKHLCMISSTYGDGGPPANAAHFISNLNSQDFDQSFSYSIVGFGSTSYPNFCQYALDIRKQMESRKNAKEVIPIKTINNRDNAAFFRWVDEWNSVMELPRLSLNPKTISLKREKKEFEVLAIRHSPEESDKTFVLELRLPGSVIVQSGDLFKFLPENETVPRQYSIGVLRKKSIILLAIKRHERGLASNILSKVGKGQNIEAEIVNNQHFHLPKGKTSYTFIANGTGVGPFLGMISKPKRGCDMQLYLGLRTKKSLELFHPYLDDVIKQSQQLSVQLAYSREAESMCYVQDLINDDIEMIINRLAQGGIIMICGSLKMKDGVMKVLSDGCERLSEHTIDFFITQKQILTDCY